MSGDIAFEDQLQRTISVDIRYILFIIDYYAEAKHIIDELTLVKTSDKEMDKIEKEETQSLINTINELIKEFPEIIKSENTSSDELSFSKAFLNARNLKKIFFPGKIRLIVPNWRWLNKLLMQKVALLSEKKIPESR